MRGVERDALGFTHRDASNFAMTTRAWLIDQSRTSMLRTTISTYRDLLHRFQLLQAQVADI
jgi:hypothetical protein